MSMQTFRRASLPRLTRSEEARKFKFEHVFINAEGEFHGYLEASADPSVDASQPCLSDSDRLELPHKSKTPSPYR
jgi:hypothetical protein